MNDDLAYFLPYQRQWITDPSPLRIIQKSRQIGLSYADAYRSVRLASLKSSRRDVYVSSRDLFQAKLYIEDCKHWADILHEVILDLGEVLLDPAHNASAYVIQFANGRRIYSLSSNPNALAGKRGDVVLDEFALHEDQRLLYRIAKPVTTWGGTLSIISTHRGANTLFNQLIRDITQNHNPMGWSLHSVPIQTAVAQGLVERINQKNPARPPESRAQFLARLRAECIDEEQWFQEYCCLPADENAAFLSYDLINACQDSNLQLLTLDQLPAFYSQPSTLNPQLYLGVDVARTQHLAVLYVAEKIGDSLWDRARLEFHNTPFSQLEAALYSVLALPQLKRACIDATGLGLQLAERAHQRFPWKVEPVNFSQALKSDLAFTLRSAFEDKKLHLVRDDKLRADLHGLKQEVTPSGNSRFLGDADDSHCDRTWALALCLRASRPRPTIGARLG